MAEGRLRGLRLDAGGSYRDPTIIGYRRADKIGYSLRLAKNRPVELTLRVDNALDENEPH